MDMTGLTQRKVQVIDGMRGVDSEPTATGTYGVPILPAVPEGERWFRSRSRAHRQHLGKLPDRYDNLKQETTPGFEFTAVFENHELRIPEYFMRHHMPQEFRDEFVRRLDKHPMNGVDFFDMAKLHEKVAANEEAQVRATLDGNPVLKAKLLAEAGLAEGFGTPPKKALTVTAPEPEQEQDSAPQEPTPPAPKPKRARASK